MNETHKVANARNEIIKQLQQGRVIKLETIREYNRLIIGDYIDDTMREIKIRY